MTAILVEAGELMARRNGSVNPVNFSDEVFELHSIPAFDAGRPDILVGSKIGSSKQIVQSNDVMISKIVPHIRRASVVGAASGKRQIASGEWIVFRSDRVFPHYLRHFLMSDEFNAQFMSTVSGVGGSLLRARPAQVAKIKIPLPSLAEQRRIAAILDKADALRAKRREAITKLDQLLESIFLDLFGDPLTNPKCWPIATIGEISTFITSGSRGWAKYYVDRGAKFIRIQNLVNGDLDMDDCAYVDAPQSAESRRTLVREGDVLVSITADLGRTAVVPKRLGKAHINQHIAILRLQGIDPSYVSHFLAGPGGRVQFQKMNRSAVKAGLNFDDIRSLKILVPPEEVQGVYLSAIHAIRQHRRRFEVQLSKLDQMFSVVQQRAFAGAL